MENSSPIMIVAGTRPEVTKLSPVIWWFDRLGVEYVLFGVVNTMITS